MLLCYDQVVSEGHPGRVSRSPSPLVQQPRKKWLNIVFDLNGVLCQCAMKSSVKHMKTYHVHDNVFCHWVPTIVAAKAVYVRPYVREFLRVVNDITEKTVIWSSMMKSNSEHVAQFLFAGGRWPYDVLSQEQCSKIETSHRRFLRYPHSDKNVFLKVLEEQFFSNPNGCTSFTRDNTLLIDDSPEKSLCNENGNAIFLDSWTREHHGDNFLVETLAPWLQRLHTHCPPGRLREYVVANRIGRDPLPPSNGVHQWIIQGMNESARNLGSSFRVPGLDVVIGPHPR